MRRRVPGTVDAGKPSRCSGRPMAVEAALRSSFASVES